MRSFKFFSVGFFYICLGCSSEIDISTTVFEVENIGDREIPYTYYEKKGFKLIYDDVTIFEKKKNDTLIQLYIDEEFKTIERKIWKIKLSLQKKEDLENWFFKHKVLFIAPVMEHRANWSDYKYFSVSKQVDNTIFTCKIKQEYDINYLFIEYHYPLKGKNLKKNIEFYKKWDGIPIYDEAEAEGEETKMLYEKK